MLNKPKIAIFDFCDTIFKGQSFNHFITYLIDNESFCNRYYLKIRKTLIPFIVKNSMERKAFLLKPYRGKSQQFFSQKGEFFFNEIIQKRLYLELIHLIKEHQKKGDDVVVISGGLSIYLSFFVKAYHIKSYFATDLEFENDLFTGKIHGKECLGEEKVARLNKQINLELYDLEQSVVYTDHESDLPLLNLVGKGVIVKRNQDVSWRSENHSVMQIN